MKHFPDRDDLQAYLRGLVESAHPADAPAGGPPPLTVLGLPDDPAGQQVGRALPGLSADGQVLEARMTDEILILQEYRGVTPVGVLDRAEARGHQAAVPSPPTRRREAVPGVTARTAH